VPSECLRLLPRSFIPRLSSILPFTIRSSHTLPHALQSAPSRFAPFRLGSRRPRPTPRRSLVRCSGASLLILAGNKCRLIRLRGNAGVSPAVHVPQYRGISEQVQQSWKNGRVARRAAGFKGSHCRVKGRSQRHHLATGLDSLTR